MYKYFVTPMSTKFMEIEEHRLQRKDTDILDILQSAA